MNVFIAFDKFKDSLSASKACEIASNVLQDKKPAWSIQTTPLTDGGEGFCEILTHACHGKILQIPVHGPRFQKIKAILGIAQLKNLDKTLTSWLQIPEKGTIAIIEMAQASGLQILEPEQRTPWFTSSYGTGELIQAALKQKADTILIGAGGSATNDLACGALEALGLRFLTEQGIPLQHLTPDKWKQIAKIEGILPQTIPIRIACDVKNPLTGKNGAVAVYATQKGLNPTDISCLDQQTLRIAQMLCKHFDKNQTLINTPGSGAAGGLPFGLSVACQAKYVSGSHLITQWLNLKKKIKRSDLIISGEGKFDKSSLQGKGPGTLIRMATQMNKPIWIFAGQVEKSTISLLPETMNKNDILQISQPDQPLEQALRQTPNSLKQTLIKKLCVKKETQ
jgi:glycerate 2-kinase